MSEVERDLDLTKDDLAAMSQALDAQATQLTAHGYGWPLSREALPQLGPLAARVRELEVARWRRTVADDKTEYHRVVVPPGRDLTARDWRVVALALSRLAADLYTLAYFSHFDAAVVLATSARACESAGEKARGAEAIEVEMTTTADNGGPLPAV